MGYKYTTTRKYNVINEPVYGYVCNKCINKYRLKYFIYALPFIFLEIFLMNLDLNDGWPVIVGIIILCPILAFVPIALKTNNNIGDELLKYSNWTSYRSVGYDEFFTTKEYNSLLKNEENDNDENDLSQYLTKFYNYFAGGILFDLKYHKDSQAEKKYEKEKELNQN